MKMKISEINIRDPFVLPFEGKYYMYGTRGAGAISRTGFDVYISDDLKEWSGPVAVFERPEGFWADRDYWAPEVHFYKGAFYAFISLKSRERRRGTQILVSDSPSGPFRPHGNGPVTPENLECLDGTLYIDEAGQPHMVFCHEWVQAGDGGICSVKLSSNLEKAISEPAKLFTASCAPWSRPIGEGTSHVTDGPWFHRPSGGVGKQKPLVMLWSGFSGNDRYVQALSISENGTLEGPWTHDFPLLYNKDGGHGMTFTSFSGDLYLILHTPNKGPLERPLLIPLEGNGLLPRVK